MKNGIFAGVHCASKGLYWKKLKLYWMENHHLTGNGMVSFHTPKEATNRTVPPKRIEFDAVNILMMDHSWLLQV